MSSGSIAGYTFNADTYCTQHILDELPTGVGERFDGWAGLDREDVEHSLNELAFSFGIDREDETTFDSGDFPKEILGQHMDDSRPTECGACGEDVFGRNSSDDFRIGFDDHDEEG